MKVAVLMGGQYAEREVSLVSGQNVLNALLRQGIDAEAIDVDEHIFQKLTSKKFDKAFVALHGRGGEDGVVQALLEALNIPYTGSSVLASALSMDKIRCRWLWQGLNIPFPPFTVLEANSDWQAVIDQFGLPLFVKPAAEGSSIGISKVNSLQELKDAYVEASKYSGPVIVEKFIDGPEYTVGILNNQTLPIIRIEAAEEFYDYAAKYLLDSTQYHIPCGLSAEKEKELQQLALKAYQALGCRNWGRVDVMCDKAGNFYFLEVNTIPGLTEHSLVPKAAKAVGLSFDELILKILQTI